MYQDDADYEAAKMQSNVDDLADAVVGHRIVKVEPHQGGQSYFDRSGTAIFLDNGKKVLLRDTNDCCAYTELRDFLINANNVDHIITGVDASNDFETWHIFADMGDVLTMSVGWSSGNTGYYGFGFHIEVVDV